MSGTTSVPPPAWSDKGFIVPQESDVLNGVLQDMQSAFGGTMNTALETPQGQLASSLAAIIAEKNDQFLALTQGVDPSYASGRMQDAIGRIYFIERNPALPTTVVATCVGLAGVPIPIGALARAADDSGGRVVWEAATPGVTVIGSSRQRIPVASAIAFAMAGDTGGRHVSPRP